MLMVGGWQESSRGDVTSLGMTLHMTADGRGDVIF